MDVASLQARIEELTRENAALCADHEALLESTAKVVADRDRLQQRVAELEVCNRRLVDMLWGRRSERRQYDPDQLLLPAASDWLAPESPAMPDETTAGDDAQAALDAERIRNWQARRRRRREQPRRCEEFPPHIERRETVLDLSEEAKEGLQYIGDAVSERLRFEKPHAYVERIVRRKYVRRGEPERGVVSPPAPLAIVPGCKFDFSVIAAMVALKFAFHQPTYRQQDWFSQTGWFPSRSTINDLISLSVTTVSPLVTQMWQLLLQQVVLLIDETRILLLTRGALTKEQLAQLRKRKQAAPLDDDSLAESARTCPGSVTSYAWLFTSPQEMAPYNLFHWSLTRQQATVDEILADYRGTIVGDAYDGYVYIQRRSRGRIVHASCNTHARREFVRAETYQPILCAQMLSAYRQLYAIEERAEPLPAAERVELRQREAVPIWQRIETWLRSDAVVRAALPSSPFGKAVGYLTNQWQALQRYLVDGNVPISNDEAERIIRPLTVGRRNWLFLGHPGAALGRMQLLSVVSSAHRHHLVVEDYLADVLAKLADAQQHHPSDLELGAPYLLDLLPDRWAAAHPQSVRQARIAEQRDLAEARQVRRALRRQEARDQQRSPVAG